MSNFKIIPIEEIEGAYYLNREVFEDNRGNFSELQRPGIIPGVEFVQTNQSYSDHGVLRGLHIQRNNPQGKLVTCLFGVIRDFAIDLRPESKTFLATISLKLDWKDGGMIYLPPGCAHGFMVLSRGSVVHYSCTTEYDADSDGGISWKSPELAHIMGELYPIVSTKDQRLPLLSEYLKESIK